MEEKIVTCQLCGFQSTQLQFHVKKYHNLTGKEYKEKFPNSQLVCKKVRILTSESKKGDKNPHYGKHTWKYGLTKETDERIRIAGEKTGKALKGKPNLAWKDKKLEDIVGSFEKAQEIKKEQSRSRKGRYAGDKNPAKKPGVGAKISKAKMGHEVTKETRIKLRLRRIEQLTVNGKKWASYNIKGCEYFKSWDEQNNTKGQYAVYGGGEYLIPGLWFSPDYTNHDIKKFKEWDEPRHYDKFGNLKPKDVQRQKEIQEAYPDHEFERIKVDRNDNILEIKLYPALNTLLKGDKG